MAKVIILVFKKMGFPGNIISEALKSWNVGTSKPILHKIAFNSPERNGWV